MIDEQKSKQILLQCITMALALSTTMSMTITHNFY